MNSKETSPVPDSRGSVWLWMEMAFMPSVYAVCAVIMYVFAWCFTRSVSSGGVTDWEFSFLFAAAYGVGASIFALPTCIFFVAPALRFSPISLRFQQPFIAAFIGALIGPFAIYLLGCILVILQGTTRWADFGIDRTAIRALGIPSALAGAIFAFFYARKMRSIFNPKNIEVPNKPV